MTGFRRNVNLAENLPSVCRLGLASRGNTHLKCADVQLAMENGIHYLNWCTHEDGMSEAIRRLNPAQRKKIVIALQFNSITHDEAEEELTEYLKILNTNYIDVITLYYVESKREWNEILSDNGSMGFLNQARNTGKVRMIGVTSHQRSLAAEMIQNKDLDLLMIRYNAAHRGAEIDIFPLTQTNRSPVVAFTCTRWGELMKTTPDDPADFSPLPAEMWYRFVLACPDVSVALMAPENKKELLENLSILENWKKPSISDMLKMREHGDRVKKNAPVFP